MVAIVWTIKYWEAGVKDTQGSFPNDRCFTTSRAGEDGYKRECFMRQDGDS